MSILSPRWVGALAAVLAIAIGASLVSAEEPDSERGSWLGIWIGDAVDGGLRVVGVVRGGPAAAGGLQAGDLIVEAAGHPVNHERELDSVLESTAPGEALELRVLRGGQVVPLVLRTARRSGAAPGGAWLGEIAVTPPVEGAPGLLRYFGSGAAEWERWGLEVVAIPETLRVHYGAPGEAGVLVSRIVTEGLAAQAGLRVGDVVIRAGNARILDPGQLRSTLGGWQHRTTLPLELVRDRRRVTLDLEPAIRVAAPSEPVAPDDERFVRRRLELEIERLERRLADLRRELAELESER